MIHFVSKYYISTFKKQRLTFTLENLKKILSTKEDSKTPDSKIIFDNMFCLQPGFWFFGGTYYSLKNKNEVI